MKSIINTKDDKIYFLPKPKINPQELSYLGKKNKDVYANLFQIKIKKKLKLYQYPFSVFPEVGEGDFRIRFKLFKACIKELKKIYGECFISGDSLYANKKIEENQNIQCQLVMYVKGEKIDTTYFLQLQKFSKERIIKEEDIQKDPLTKQFIEILIRDILHANPNLEFYKGFFVLKNDKKTIQTGNAAINFYPGYATSFMETDTGNYLNVTLKNKIIQRDTILDYLKQNNYENSKNHQSIARKLKNRSFKVEYTKKNYVIFDILFNRNPTNQTFNYEGGTVVLNDYYENIKKIKIEDKNQPIIVVKKKGPQDEDLKLYFIPELCYLAGLEDNEVKDKNLMKEIAQFTKLTPNDKVKKINDFLSLLTDKKKNKDNTSAYEKSEEYGIEVLPIKRSFKAYYMKEPTLVGERDLIIDVNERVFPIYKKIVMNSWICFYQKKNYYDAENLFTTLKKASKGYGIKIFEPEWIEMDDHADINDWISTIDDYFGKGKQKYSFAVFLLDHNNNDMYSELKTHSLCNNGYISQVVKVQSLKKKGIMSVCSKILLQINAKLRGSSYIIKNHHYNDIMAIGIDSSYVKGKGRCIAMVASIDNSFSDFFNRQDIIKEDDEENINRIKVCVSSFIEDAIKVYKSNNNKKLPMRIIIYRQGVSLQQKQYLKEEIEKIDELCINEDIDYYYILVNTKTTFKFFEMTKEEIGNKPNKLRPKSISGKKVKNKNIINDNDEEENQCIIKYHNPEPGLLIFDGVTNRNYFEFYIQPQQVTGGSATPTCFHVAYGNLNEPNLIPKLTYDLCYIYSNWQGTVRVPNVIKAAEKLSKMTAKYTFEKLNSKLKLGQAYL